MLELRDPRSRISRTETRGQPFSCLGELCWYLAGSNELDFIAYYIPEYKAYADEGVIFGGYGPRFFHWKGINQFRNVIVRLQSNPDTRKAVIQLFDSTDLVEEHNDIPCTCTLQFLARNGRLDMVTYMRSNDAYKGLPHDVFAFTMLHEIFARSLALDLGTYKHAIGSLHLYDKNRRAAQHYLDEGWQSTKDSMPPMPDADPWPSIELLTTAEAAIRTKSAFDAACMENLDPYWQDLIRLLQVFRFWRSQDADGIETIKRKMSSEVYSPFIEKKLSALTEHS
jgi:thymidylate synthase